MKKLKNRNIFLIFTIILSLGITLGAVYFMYQYRDSRENSLSTGLISLKFTDQSNTVNLSSNVPMIDDLGLKNTPYEFTIENTSKVPINVDIKVDVDNNTSIHLGAVRYGIYIDDKLVKKDYIHNDLILYTYEELLRDESINCKIKFWVDYYYDRPNQTFIGKIKAEGSSRDKLFNGVTVTFDPNGGAVDINSKEVGIGETYGKLPTPTRDGYTFMGWNGVQLLENTDTFDGYSLGFGDVIDTFNTLNGSYSVKTQSAWRGPYFDLKKIYDDGKISIGDKVTVSIYYMMNFVPTRNTWLKLWRYSTDDYSIEERIIANNIIPNKWYRVVFSFDIDNYSIQRTNTRIESSYYDVDDPYYLGNNRQNYLWFARPQVQLGDTATEYEPYFITSKTKVVQQEDHTLKAIWKKNS